MLLKKPSLALGFVRPIGQRLAPPARRLRDAELLVDPGAPGQATPQEFYTSAERFAVCQRFTRGYRIARWALTTWADS